jgi:hypothetical protein
MASQEAIDSLEKFAQDCDAIHPELLDAMLNQGASSRILIKTVEDYIKLLNVIKDVHGQRGDDICKDDIDIIYQACGLPIPEREVGDKKAMLKNCERFIETKCSGGAWKSYVELEEEIRILTNKLTIEREFAEKAKAETRTFREAWNKQCLENVKLATDMIECEITLKNELAAAKIENARLKEEKEDLRDRYYKKVYELETYQAINPSR